jgi:hypothetical protein
MRSSTIALQIFTFDVGLLSTFTKTKQKQKLAGLVVPNDLAFLCDDC